MTSLAFDTNITDSVSTAVGMLNRDNGTAFDWPSAVHGPVYIFSKRLDKWFLCGCTNNVYNPGHCEMSLSAPSGSIPILKLKSASLSAPDESQNIAVTWANKSLSFPGFEFYGPWKIERLVLVRVGSSHRYIKKKEFRTALENNKLSDEAFKQALISHHFTSDMWRTEDHRNGHYFIIKESGINFIKHKAAKENFNIFLAGLTQARTGGLSHDSGLAHFVQSNMFDKKVVGEIKNFL